MAILLGITLLFESAVNICTVLTSVKIVKNQHPDIYVEEDYIFDDGNDDSNK